jgi:glutamate-1-semialdehyde aminotransferase/transketolase C-terminal domain/subunit
MTMPLRYEDALMALASVDDRIVVMTAENRAAIRSLPARMGARFIDVGICEQTMVGAAAGLALRGRIPFVHALATFLTMRAYEFIRTDLGIANLPVKLIGAVPGFLSEANGPTHQAIEDIGILRTIPGLSIACPADEDELAAALPTIASHPGPTYVRYVGGPAAFAHRTPWVFGQAERLCEGDDVAILTYGYLTREALAAAERLRAQGRSVRVSHMRTLAPIDTTEILDAARNARLLVTVEDHFKIGGLGSIVAEVLTAHATTARHLPIALDARWFRPALLADVLAVEGFNAEILATRIETALEATVGRKASDHVDARYPDITRSDEYFRRARGLIPAVTQTLAKGPSQWVKGVAPKYLERGAGCRVWDVDGNEYLDFNMAVGPLSLGYCHPAVDHAIRAQLDKGITFTLMHPLEVEVAETVRDMVPGAERVRFSKTGCDVTTAAVRLARAFTGRDRVLCCGYHGWHDWYIAVTPRKAGIPAAAAALTNTFAYNDLDSVAAALDDETACVILEPTVFEAPKPGFLEDLRRLCDERGALLIFDEMWTGFRLALGGAQQRFGIRADLACFSKAVANGMPLSVLTGRGDVMDLLENDVFFFTTFGGEALSLAAARATLEEMRRHDVPAHLQRVGDTIRTGYNVMAQSLGLPFTRCVGFGARTQVVFDAANGCDALEMKSLVQQELIARGILWSGFHNVSLAHGDAEAQAVLNAYADVLPLLRNAVQAGDVRARLRGEPVEPVFRRTSDFNTKPRPRLEPVPPPEPARA